MSSTVAEKFFGSSNALQETLVKAVLEAMKDKHIEPDELDRRCLFKYHNLPSCAEFTAEPKLMKASTFGLASFALGLKVDEVLGVNTPAFAAKIAANKTWIIEHMKANKAYLAGALGVLDQPTQVTVEDLIPVYIVLKSLESIEPKQSLEATRPSPFAH